MSRLCVRAGGFLLALGLLVTACSGPSPSPNAQDDQVEPKTPVGLSPSSRATGTADEPAGNWFESACELPRKHLERIGRGYFPGRSPEITLVPREPNFFGTFTATSHSGPWDYVQRVPLVFYGPGYVRAQSEISVDRETTTADIAATIAELLRTRFPRNRPGRPITEALLPPGERQEPPRVILTVVWDGGGTNVLGHWRRAWPHLENMISQGTSVSESIAGSSPSVTPAVHASIGTGAFPDQHGIVDIPLRINGQISDSWPDKSPKHLRIPTLADLYDRRLDNRPKVGIVADHGWHLGMIGHGAYLTGGDKDYVVLFKENRVITNRQWFRLPVALQNLDGFEDDVRRIDAADGKLDSKWMDNDVLSEPAEARETPAGTLYETRMIKALMSGEGFGRDDVPDLLFVNYKQIDYVGHRYNLLEPEMGDAVRYSDAELGELTRWLDEEVGKGRWVMALTADHGSTPYAESTGAWPIGMPMLKKTVANHFRLEPEELFDEDRVTGLWINRQTLREEGLSVGAISNYIMRQRIEDNAPQDADIPAQYESRLEEPLFAAAFPSIKTPEILRCAGLDP